MRSKKARPDGSMVFVFLILLAAVAAFVWGCTAPDRAQHTLEAEGYEDIEVGGYTMWGCTDSATFRNSFEATRNGQAISGAVCCTFMTCEVRLY